MLGTRPWWSAPIVLRRHLGLALVGVLGGLLVGIVAATPTLFVDSVGSGAVQHQWSRGCPGIIAPTVTRWAEGVGIDPTLAIESMPEYSHFDLTLTSPSLSFVHGDRHTPGGLLSRPGAVDHLNIVDRVDHGDLWISDAQAEALGVKAGDSISFNLFDEHVEASVHGIYRDMTTGALGPYWCSVEKALRPLTAFTDAVPPPRAIVDPSAERKILVGAAFRATFAVAAAPRTLPDAQRLADSVPVLKQHLDQLVDQERRRQFGDNVSSQPGQITIAEGFTRLAARALAVRGAVRTAIVPLSILAVVCALAVAAAIGAMWVRSRRNDVVAVTSMGVGPWSIGLKAALEYLLPVAAGAAVGALLARLALVVYAPATELSPGTFLRSVWWALGAGAVALVLIGVVAALAARGVMRAVPRRIPAVIRWFPLELLLGFAAWRSYRSFHSGSLIELHDKEAVVGGAALSFPLLVFATCAVVAARLWFLGLRRSARPMRRLVPGLAVRRLRAGRSLGAVLVGLGALAVGVAVYGAGLVTSLHRTQVVKAKSFVGSDVLVRVTNFLDTPTPGATQVEMSRDFRLGDVDVDVIAVDPDTFAGAAFWDDSFSSRSLADLLAALAARPDGAIFVGIDASDGTLRPKGADDGRTVHAVAHLGIFPTMRNNKPMVVITRRAAHDSEFLLSRDVLAKGGTQRSWNDELRRLGTVPVWSIVPDGVVDSSQMLFAEWTFVFVRALGVFVGALVIVALLLQLIARQRQQSVAVGILRRMGISRGRQRLALVAELALLGAAMIVVGVVAALLVSRVVTPRLDPLPIIAPAPLTIIPLVAIGVLVAVAAVSILVGSWLAQASAARTNLAEALRDQ